MMFHHLSLSSAHFTIWPFLLASFLWVSVSAWQETAKLLPTIPVSGSRYGRFSDVLGDTIAVSTYLDNSTGTNSGSVYVCVQYDSSWILQTQLIPSDGKPEDRFGASVHFEEGNNNRLYIGATRGNGLVNQSGCIYQFDRYSGATWGQSPNKIYANDGQTRDGFGAGVAISGNMMLVGAINRQGFRGGVYCCFVRASPSAAWVQDAILSPADTVAYDQVGFSVALDGDTAVLGNYKSNANGAPAPGGSVYVYVRTSGAWQLYQTITPDQPLLNHRNGARVAIAGDILVVASNGRIFPNPISPASTYAGGAMYAFARPTAPADFVLTKKFRDFGSPLVGWQLGSSGLVLKNNTLVAGAGGKGAGRGSIMVYQTADGGQSCNPRVQELTASDGKLVDGLG